MKPKFPLPSAFLSLALAPAAFAVDGTWTGGSAATWDTTATNWSVVSGAPWDSTAGVGNRAVFNTAGATPVVSGTVYSNGLGISQTVTISGGSISLVGTTPVVDASADATISSTLTGIGSVLTKTGAGTLTLTGINDYTGATIITGGVISTYLLANNGVASGIGAGTGTAGLVIDGGTLKYTGPANNTSPGWTRGYTIGNNGATFDLSTATGQLWIGGAVAYSGSGARTVTVITGASGGRYNSALGDGTGGATSIVKNGTGTLLITGTNTYTGQLQILQGTVQYGNVGAGGESSGVGHSVAISSGANLTFRHGATDVIAYSAPISGAGSVTMNSSVGSVLTLSGPNSYSGTTTLTAGTLAIGVGSVGSVGAITSSAIGTGTLTFNGGTLSSNGATARTILNPITFSASGNAGLGDATNNGKLTFSATVALGTAVRTLTLASDAQFDGVISGSGGITKAGAGMLILANIANTYTGVTTISGGVLSTGVLANSGVASGIGQASSSAANLVIDGGTLKYTGGAVSSWSRPFTIGANSTTFDLSSAAGQLNIAGTIAYSGSGTRSLTLTTGANGGRLNSALANGTGGATSLVKTGTGTLIISGSNTYTGQLQVQEGTAQIGNANAGGESSGVGHSVAVSSGATLAFRHASTDAVTFNAPISGDGKVNFNYNNTGVGGGSLTLGGNNSFTGGLTISPSSGSVVIPLKAGSTTALGTGNVTIGQYGTLDLNGYTNTTGLLVSTGTNGNVTNNGASDATLTLSAASGSQTFGGTIVDGTTKKISITKEGAGSQTFSNTNTYTGDTTVSAGTLKITGTIANSAVTVNNSGTVLASGTTGTIGKSVTVNTGAILAPGGKLSVGLASVGSDGLDFNSGSIFDWDITSSSISSGFDTMAVGGTIDVSTTGTIFKVVLGGDALTDIQTPGNTFWNTPYITQVWNMDTIFGEAFNSGSSFASVQTSTDVSSYGSFTINGTALTWTAVPEPTSALAGLLLTVGLLQRRRHV